VSFCQEGFDSTAEQPEPAPLQAVSDHAPEDWVRLVPPTAVTYGDAAGYSTP
jgi:hypothetical protein